MKKEEIINHILFEISKNGRSIDKYGDCVYNSNEGSHCAVGICLMSKYKCQGPRLDGNDSGLSGLIRKQKVSTLDDLLSSKFIGHDKQFWHDMQKLHDGKNHWKDYNYNLNFNGKDALRRICENHEIDFNLIKIP